MSIPNNDQRQTDWGVGDNFSQIPVIISSNVIICAPREDSSSLTEDPINSDPLPLTPLVNRTLSPLLVINDLPSLEGRTQLNRETPLFIALPRENNTYSSLEGRDLKSLPTFEEDTDRKE